MRAAAEAILACAAALGVELHLAGGDVPFILKNRLPDGSSLVSSFRENAPSFVGTTGLEVESDGVGVSSLDSGGE